MSDHDAERELRQLPIALDSLGSLSFTDGQLVVADPYLMDADPAPIVQRLRSQPYEVVLARAEMGPDHLRIAAAMLVADLEHFSEWRMAHWPEQDPATLTGDQFFGYGVDAGTGCFADVGAARVASRVLAADAGMLEDPVSRALFSSAPAAGAAVVSPEAGAKEIAIFSSGWGDGFYPTWLGMTGNGEVAVAITDFLLTSDPYAPNQAADRPAPVAVTRVSRWRKLFRR